MEEDFLHELRPQADLQSRVASTHRSAVQAKDRELAEAQRQLRQKDEQLTRKEADLMRAQETIRREQQQNKKGKHRAKEKAKQQLRQKETELVQAKERVQQQLRQKDQQLTRKEAELVRAEETIRREQQQIQEMRQRVETGLVQAKDRAQQQLRQKDQQLTRKEAELVRAEETIRREQQQIQETRQRETGLVQAKDRAQQQLRQKDQQLTRKEAELVRAEETIRREQQQIQETRQRETGLVQAKDRAQQQLRQKDQQLTRKEAELVRAEETIRREQQQIQEMRQRETELVQAKDRAQQQLRQKEEQLRSSEALVADLRLQQRDTQPQDTKLTVQCRQKKRAPCDMTRGSAATDGRFVYITPAGSTTPFYQCSTEEWMELPSCPYKNSGLAIIDSELTTVGGVDGPGHATNKLFTVRQGKWVEVYPPMNTARSSPAVVCTSDGDYLIVIGGWVSDGAVTATVELFQVKSRRWYKLTDLPEPLPFPSATICGDQLHVIGDDRNGYSCSLHSLPSNDGPITSPLTLSWKSLPPLPVTGSTAATLCGQLVLIGGRQYMSPANSIRQLVEGQWVKIGSMTSGRYWCLAVSPSPGKILIVGGVFEDSVEECVAV